MTNPTPPLFTKTASELLDYLFDFTDQLTEDGDDTLASASAVVPSGLTAGAGAATLTGFVQWISGGTVDTTYTITCTALTVGGRTYVRTIYLRIVNSK